MDHAMVLHNMHKTSYLLILPRADMLSQEFISRQKKPFPLNIISKTLPD